VTKSDRVPGEVPYYGASGQVDSVHENLFDDDLLLISEDGANLLMRTYPIAFSISGKSWVNNHAHILKFEDMATQRLVEYYFNSISVAPWVSGMAQPKLNQKALNTIPVPLPPEDEREKLVAELDKLADGIERLEANQEERLAMLAALKQSLLHRAFNGELTAAMPETIAA
jgi:type I restriction enzyme S subunit